MFLRLFILITALLNALGWLLSIVGGVNRTGYLVTLLPAAAVLAFWLWRRVDWYALPWTMLGKKWWHRYSRSYPLAFVLIATLVLASGGLFEPDHNDGLCFRLPRMLHWLVAQGWHWIDTNDPRLNIRGAGFEWSALPLLLFTGGNRALFLVNFAAFLCLPGLIYGTYRRLGVARRVAWNWMWILPSGYGLVLGASNIGNDLLLVVYALAALGLALRGVERRSFADLTFSILAASLLTATKQTALPLLLPWLVALAPGWPVLWREKGKSGAVIALALGISVAFISWSNWQHTGDWSGLVTDTAIKAHQNPLLNFTGNTALITIQNLVPPVFPWRDDWLQLARQWQQTPLGQLYTANFETNFLWLPIRMNATFAPLGPGVFGLLLIACGYAVWRRLPSPVLTRYQKAVRAAVIVSCLVLLLQTAMWQISRHFLAYAFCLIPFFLIGDAQSRLVRSRTWRWLVILQFAHVLAALLFLAPRSPLAALGLAPDFYLSQAVQTPASDAWVRRYLPASARTVGVIRSEIDAETWLWQPPGSRRIIDCPLEMSAADYERRGIEYIVISSEALEAGKISLDQWLERHRCTLITTIRMSYHPWYLVRRSR